MEGIILLLGLICGNLIGYFIEFSQSFVLIFFLVLGIVGLILPKGRKEYFIFLFALIIMLFRFQQIEKNYLWSMDNKFVEVQGTIIDKIHSNGETHYTLKSKSIGPYKKSIRLRIQNNHKIHYRIGDEITTVARYEIPRENGNPYGFNYRNYLAKSNIFGQIAPKSKGLITGHNHHFLYKIRNVGLDAIEKSFDEYFDASDANLYKTIFLGDKYINNEEIDTIRQLGISHIIAISGFHIALIYTLLEFLFQIFHFPRRKARWIILSIIWAYTYMIGMPASCLRAALMITMIAACKNFDLPWNEKNVLYLAFSIILFLRPYELYNIGCLLSFFATYAIFYFRPTHITKNKTWANLKMTMQIYIFLLPILLYSFNEITTAVIIGNLLIVPLYTGLIMVGVIFLCTPFKAILSYTTYPILRGIDHLSYASKALFARSISIRSLNIYEIILYYIFLYLFMEKRRLKVMTDRQKTWIFKMVTCISISVVLSYLWLQPVKINFIDVGQGDSMMIRTRNRTYLFDVGGSYKESNISEEYAKYLKQDGVTNVDTVFLTHFDEDHAGNMKILKEKFPQVSVVSRKGGSQILKNKYKIDTNYIEWEHLSTAQLGEVQLKAYHTPHQDENENSMVYHVTIHKIPILVTGDIGIASEEKLLVNDLSSYILKVGHHGSKNSTSEKFLEHVNSTYSIISCGKNNTYNHPHPETLTRLNKHGQKILRTDQDGNIQWTIHRYGYFMDTTIGKIKFNEAKEKSLMIIFSILIIGYVMQFERRKNDSL